MAGDVGHTRFDTTAMLRPIAADDLDLDDGHADPFANRPPFVASEGPRIHAVGDNGLASAQVVVSHGMRDSVSLTLDNHSPVPERLFD